MSRRRVKPEQQALRYIELQVDPDFVKEKFIDEHIGRGVFATRCIESGSFIVQYYGEVITHSEGERREECNPSCFRFFFNHGKSKLCIDATDEQQFGIQGRRLGRLVNHGNTARERNARMMVLKIDTGPVLCLFATRNISAGEQILYDYGIPLKDLNFPASGRPVSGLVEHDGSPPLPVSSVVATEGPVSGLVEHSDPRRRCSYCKTRCADQRCTDCNLLYCYVCHKRRHSTRTMRKHLSVYTLEVPASGDPVGQLAERDESPSAPVSSVPVSGDPVGELVERDERRIRCSATATSSRLAIPFQRLSISSLNSSSSLICSIAVGL